MIARNGRLKLAIQKEGRITEDSVNLLRAAGLDFDIRSRALVAPCRNLPFDILSLRDDDIPEYVQDGVCDFGIVGENVVLEKSARVQTLERLGFGKCQLAICAPKNGAIRSVADLAGKRIATSYPVILRKYLEGESVKAEIIEISGAVEITPALDVADATCDILSTGSTARVNGLEVVSTMMSSEALLVGNPLSVEAAGKSELIDRLLARFRSVLRARGKKYVMMNAPMTAVARLSDLVPGMKSPTIVPLATPGMVAIHSVVNEEIFWEVMEQLRLAGAADIIVIPIEKIIA
jgi:ATP phosphoribosyltransferase